LLLLFSFGKILSTTDPAFVQTFAPFASTVSTTYDASYFYQLTGVAHTMVWHF
jgi:hypothetical protein